MIYINTTGKQNQVWLPKPYDIVISDCPGVEDAYNSGYTSGHTDGVEDGWNSGYTSGYTDGLNACSGGSGEGIWEEGYDSGYTDGQSSVDCTDFYNSGKTDGAAEQKAKMTELNVDNADLHMSPGGVLENDFYREDGWNHVWVAVDTIDWWDSGYTSGYTDGVNACSGGSYQEGYDDGWDAGYPSGKTDGIAEQKAKLTSTAFTSNGTYTRADGWSSVTVDVASGYTQDDLDRAFQSGYTAGLRACSGFTPAADLTLNVASAITGTGQATVTVNPSGAGTDITYTSSDPSKATIDEDGVITVVGNGNVTFCAIDAITELQDCKTVAVSLPAPANTNVLDFIYETSAANQTIRLFTGTAPDSPYFYAFYSAITRMDIDGVPVEKSKNNIYKTYPRSGDWYFYTFPTAGRHTVKYYMQKDFHTGTTYPGLVLDALIFGKSSEYDGSNPEYPDAMPPCPLVEAKIGSGYEYIRTGAFQTAQKLTAATIPNTIREMGPYSFEYSGLKSITIPNSVTAFTASGFYASGYGVFNNCSAMTSVTIGTGLASLPEYTFDNCTALKNVTMNRTTPPTLGTGCFRNCTSLQHIYVPASSVNTYKSASGWSNYASIISAKP